MVTYNSFDAYVLNLEKWYRWTYFQGKNRDADVENRHVDTMGGGHWDEWEDLDWRMCSAMCKT